MVECTCHPVPFEDCTTYGSAVEPGSAFEPNPDCPEHFRRPPHRLADGTWSDKVDRTHRIRSTCFAMRNKGRWHVYKGFPDFLTGHKWRLYSDRGFLRYFKTHAEAIAYADRHARTTKNGDNK